jgi:CRP-like cAMP-binding protein
MTDCAQVLAGVDVLSDFPHEFIDRCAAVSTLRAYKAGETVVSQGEPATAFYVVTQGRLDVIRDEAGAGPRVVATLEPGHFFGEMALLREGARTATVRAREDAECLVLEKADFDAQLRRDPNAAAVLATRLARRINAIRPRA